MRKFLFLAALAGCFPMSQTVEKVDPDTYIIRFDHPDDGEIHAQVWKAGSQLCGDKGFQVASVDDNGRGPAFRKITVTISCGNRVGHTPDQTIEVRQR